MEKIKVVQPLKSSQTLREEASQPMLQQPTLTQQRPQTQSSWAAQPPQSVEEAAEPAPTATVYLAPDEQEPSPSSQSAQFLTGSDLAKSRSSRVLSVATTLMSRMKFFHRKDQS